MGGRKAVSDSPAMAFIDFADSLPESELPVTGKPKKATPHATISKDLLSKHPWLAEYHTVELSKRQRIVGKSTQDPVQNVPAPAQQDPVVVADDEPPPLGAASSSSSGPTGAASSSSSGAKSVALARS